MMLCQEEARRLKAKRKEQEALRSEQEAKEDQEHERQVSAEPHAAGEKDEEGEEPTTPKAKRRKSAPAAPIDPHRCQLLHLPACPVQNTLQLDHHTLSLAPPVLYQRCCRSVAPGCCRAPRSCPGMHGGQM